MDSDDSLFESEFEETATAAEDGTVDVDDINIDDLTVDFKTLSSQIASISKLSKSPRNRILSIYHDAKFVQQVAASVARPLVANERCGRWYIPPSLLKESVYFKSTDGHMGQWDFSLRRLNLHILPLIEAHQGIVIVDSTRSGKRMPDALSKTVPEWCAVINCLLTGVQDLHTPLDAVSRSEHAQIQDRIPGWTLKLRQQNLDIPKLKKPLRPIWITPDHILPVEPPSFEDFYPIFLCTASKRIQDGESHYTPCGGLGSFLYVQGAADDHEAWAKSLTPEILWSLESQLALASQTDEEIMSLIEAHGKIDLAPPLSNAAQESVKILDSQISLLKGTDSIPSDVVINLTESPSIPSTANGLVINEPLPPGKKGAKMLRYKLPQIIDKIQNRNMQDKTISIVWNNSSEFAFGIALALYCKFYLAKKRPLSKESVREQLVKILAKYKANPSRATLNAVNDVLL